MAGRNKKMKIVCIVGARPNFLKINPLLHEFKRYAQAFSICLVHTGQHYDIGLSKIFFDELGINKYDYNLEIGSGTHAQQTAKAIVGIERILLKELPDLVLVVGDVNSTLAGAIAAAKLHIPIAHVEAGLRSFDNNMPEEINRKIVDHISTYLFTSCPEANENLKKEGISSDKIFFVGNIMIDSLLDNKKRIKFSKILNRLKLKKEEFIILTLHRPENVENMDNLVSLLKVMVNISVKLRVVFPIHPRTRKKIDPFILRRINKKLTIVNPLGYFDFQKLIANCKLVLTDSGGIQEETSFLGIPCLTLLDKTERPITIRCGTNHLVGRSKDVIIREVNRFLNRPTKYKTKIKFWDGKTARRIVRVLFYEYKKRLNHKNGNKI